MKSNYCAWNRKKLHYVLVIFFNIPHEICEGLVPNGVGNLESFSTPGQILNPIRIHNNNNIQMTHVEMGDRAMGIVQFRLDIWV